MSLNWKEAWAKFSPLRWPFAWMTWSFTGFMVSAMAWPTSKEIATVGHALSVPLSVIFVGMFAAFGVWLFARASLISVRLYSVYRQREAQFYRAPKIAREKLQEEWEQEGQE